MTDTYPKTTYTPPEKGLGIAIWKGKRYLENLLCFFLVISVFLGRK
jgi:hypothetical protein